ncbi:uncharacterized protein LOC118197715 [Stegodyphus dumicola]|uniref:uncharacterized protein LOC118197715 n=1 Tax=Stegodyphus dumicola TaxID=202533 RepID=UPI0015AD2395|nr:uncharacterized protein LOC118197715 [Stegodyphus dumicola]
MDKENVFGSRISVNFRSKSDLECRDFPPRNQNKDSSNEASVSSCSSRDSSVSPSCEREEYNLKYDQNSATRRKFDFPPPPLLNSQNYPALLRATQSETFSSRKLAENSHFYCNVGMDKIKESKRLASDWENMTPFYQSQNKNQDISAFASFNKDQDFNLKANKYCQKNVGRVSPFLMQDYNLNTTRNFTVPANEPCNVWQNSSHADVSNTFLCYPNHEHSGLSRKPSVSVSDIQRISDPVTHSSQWNGASLHADLNQTVPRNNSVPDGSRFVELNVSNLDSSFEVNEMKKILLSTFSEYVMVSIRRSSFIFCV